MDPMALLLATVLQGQNNDEIEKEPPLPRDCREVGGKYHHVVRELPNEMLRCDTCGREKWPENWDENNHSAGQVRLRDGNMLKIKPPEMDS